MVPLHQSVIFKVIRRHDRANCPYAHNFQDYRRDPKKKYYTVMSMLFSLKFVQIGLKDKSSLSKIQGVL